MTTWPSRPAVKPLVVTKRTAAKVLLPKGMVSKGQWEQKIFSEKFKQPA